MYREKKVITPVCVFHEYAYVGRYGRKGESRAPRKKATPEQVARQNHRNKVKRVQYKILCNFDEGDLWLTLKYPKGTRKSYQDARKDVDRFIARVRYAYKQAGEQLKWIMRIEIGKRGGIHVHLVMNRIEDAPRIVSDAWTRARGMTPIEDLLIDGKWCPFDGMTHYEDIRRLGNAKELAEYLVKELPAKEEYAKGVEVSDDDRKKMSSYRCSRNLAEPVVEERTFVRLTMRRIIELGVGAINTQAGDKYRTPGHIVDRETWVQGVNPVTGMSYLHFVEIATRRRRP